MALLTTPSAPAAASARCAACGLPARLAGAGYWLLDAKPYHPACAPWAERPFPFRWAVDEGRQVVARLRRERVEPSDKLARAVAYLIEAERAWAPDDPVAVLERSTLAAQLVEHWRARLKAGAGPR